MKNKPSTHSLLQFRKRIKSSWIREKRFSLLLKTHYSNFYFFQAKKYNFLWGYYRKRAMLWDVIQWQRGERRGFNPVAWEITPPVLWFCHMFTGRSEAQAGSSKVVKFNASYWRMAHIYDMIISFLGCPHAITHSRKISESFIPAFHFHEGNTHFLVVVLKKCKVLLGWYEGCQNFTEIFNHRGLWRKLNENCQRGFDQTGNGRWIWCHHPRV